MAATRRHSWGASILIVLLAVFFIWGTYRVSQYRSNSIIADSEQMSLRAATSFAETAREWILADSVEHLERGVEIMLLGSAKYIQVNYQDHLLIDNRTGEWMEIALPAPAVLPATAVASTSVRDDQRIVEATIPIRDRAFTVGYVRIGIHAQLLESNLRRSNWMIGILGTALWLLSAGATCLASVRLARRAALIPEQRRVGPFAPIRELLDQRPIVIDLQSRTISCKGVTRLLTPKPFGLLSLLLSDSSRVFSDREIMEAIWPDCRYTSSNDVHQCVYRLRKLLNEVDPDLGHCIANVKGFGYRFEIDDRVGFEDACFESANAQ